ncbi:CheR family methyltransferase [Vibrio sp. SCSIO 43136]|uniref:CheR family methyltransferase n=1 Tax=Vibrio sp. SCSIO 43136 TaxID=2819101 RepID=UPI0020758D6B|nr:CheR family methyltransferase [Vibrio sp. SCSIO 43136]USD64251.1 protein-glutamate O-methyltransferase CheR [Vibrio sp. SCSIO 43136]
MSSHSLSQLEFEMLRRMLDQHTGIDMPQDKKDIVYSRLITRLKSLNLHRFGQYIELISSPEGKTELNIFIDKMTTHETYFFREPSQFDFLHDYWNKRYRSGLKLSAWSAASASGEEAYSLAMVLADICDKHAWQVIGTDISSTSVSIARDACYPISAAERIPSQWRKQYCLKGIGPVQGRFVIGDELKQRCLFVEDNLLSLKNANQTFDIIFLRNVLIYFDEFKQRKILDNVIQRLNRSGLLFLGHAETPRQKRAELELLEPCIYRKVGV